MPRLYFSGLVLPERAPLSVSGVHASIVGPDGAAHALIALNIWANQISATVDSEETDVLTLRNLVRAEAEFVTSLAGFLLGFGYDVEITKAFNEDLSQNQVFGIDVAVLTARAQGRDLSTVINAVLPLCYGADAIFLRRCLTDLSLAMKRLDDTAFYCFRAIESLKQSFGSHLTEREQWSALAAAVESTKAEMEPLRARAFPARHGPAQPLSDAERQELFIYTWRVVERYIDYRLAERGAPKAFQAPPDPAASTFA